MLKLLRGYFHKKDVDDEDCWQVKNSHLVALIGEHRVEEAQVAALDLLDYVDKKYKKDTKEKATAYNNAGMAFLVSREYPLAEECFQSALVIRKRLFGNDHNEVAVILLNLIQLYKAQVQEIMSLNRVETK